MPGPRPDNCAELGRFVKTTLSLRAMVPPSRFMHIACGRLDGYWELTGAVGYGSRALIVQEAGGTVTQVDGKPYNQMHRSILASNGLIHQAMVEKLRE
jgi:myo-inositol-1(or 4)-monophosphatase